ncbi:5-formyltetrahydrofolate cyclo-ligase [Kitasatospora aureofaciens]|uniref:5-formyltetrahydrofolate cyclo-ligase n=3 Tax=Kitasatospora aureofaciens TaxID=1894 RepID=A0A1E7NA50_KITAU|nr:5-formyltetrahydrofolate cyclo-ligase [Kitasatospora aureofaciens]QEV00200.1 5-formyltetrahydrofolate cyclo-ligase [Streptomyces viridifaciens]ARF79000.1 5-formyltetrahydrofolate cyclo-ligase [Kitasatospora aureofaciens]OEV37570.1 5-formyltetrahydrofolate cyclo-ligase [Kitasatospora aureofaciens]UKZ06407.1 5-formyltetrahydrofolate cyclo-ligase [Streptomyces viridifaciens]GGU83621.1 5-formyltetrahydrofolate cyclo-ligase [Kitasatospora aureofaciens]
MHNEKSDLRTRLLTRRRALTAEGRAEAADALAGHAWELAAPGSTVAAYVSVGAEPGTRPLLDALRESGVRVLLPVLLPDNDLDWAEYAGPQTLVPAGRGLLEPVGPRLGPEAVTGASVVLLPGLAVDRGGLRLGRGGGSYDRVLARLGRAGVRPVLAVLLYEHELLERVPAEPHDLPVDLAITPSGVRTLG